MKGTEGQPLGSPASKGQPVSWTETTGLCARCLLVSLPPPISFLGFTVQGQPLPECTRTLDAILHKMCREPWRGSRAQASLNAGSHFRRSHMPRPHRLAGPNRYLKEEPLGPEMDWMPHSIHEAVHDVEKEVEGRQAEAEAAAAGEPTSRGGGKGSCATRRQWVSSQQRESGGSKLQACCRKHAARLGIGGRVAAGLCRLLMCCPGRCGGADSDGCPCLPACAYALSPRPLPMESLPLQHGRARRWDSEEEP